MNNKNYQVEKLCGFYVSDWHLTTTILPYINSKIDEKTNVITILENNIEENIKVLEKFLNLSEKEKIEIKSLKRGESLMFVDKDHILTKIESNEEERKLIM